MSKRTRAGNPAHKPAPALKLDLGCGPNKKPGFFGVDSIAFPGVDKVMDIGKDVWPFKNDSVEEFHCSHVIEHLTWPQRVHFFNQLYRVMKPGAKGALILPHWASMRYYGDPTHQSAMSEFAFYYLSRPWRAGGVPIGAAPGTAAQPAQAPHTDIQFNPGGYDCNFEVMWGHSLHPQLQSRNAEYQQHALTFWKDAAQDLMATLIKR